ncbi:MAG: RsmE family RNA methyltransferase [Chloroflexota bacterium]|nr:RsmE family RNA methyltransferase [Chloroflexota bacterium]
MQRFFIPRQAIDRDKVTLKGDIVHQVRDVLRMKSGDRILVLDDSGWEYEVVLNQVDRDRVAGTICDSVEIAETDIKITLYQAMLKSDKFEFVLQKCTEIGVSTFIPIVSERCVARQTGAKKLGRWNKILTEAAEQSGKGKLPRLCSVTTFQQACQLIEGFSMIFLSEVSAPGLRQILHDNYSPEIHTGVNIFVGPEGGFSPSEVQTAQTRGIMPVTLGKSILRSETAGLVASTAILYEYGEFDRPLNGNSDAL